MDYKEAVKHVTAMKNKPNMMIVNLSYNQRVILPYADGLALMAALQQAEILSDRYAQQISIKPMSQDSVTCAVISRDDYDQIKIAELLGVSLDAVKEMKLNLDKVV